MQKIYISNLKYNNKKEIDTEKNEIYRLNKNTYFKMMKNYNANEACEKERKIIYADNIKGISSIVKPKCAVYLDAQKSKYIGYIMDRVDGVEFDHDNICKNTKYSDSNLYRYADLYLKLEKIVKSANRNGVIIPDLCSINNVLIDSSDKIHIIDYDDMQVGSIDADCLSSIYSLSNLSEKYYKDGLFNDNLDKKSLLYMYLKITFNMNPDVIQKLTYKKDGSKLIKYLGIKDYDIKNKIGSYFNDEVDNDYLGYTTMQIADRYDLSCSKKLVKKKIVSDI